MQQLFGFGLQHFSGGDTRPRLHHFGNFGRSDFFDHHRVVVIALLLLLFGSGDRGLDLRDFSVLQPSGAFPIAATHCPL